MAAAYDTYDYPSYWEGREYEHISEEIALKAFLDKIPKIKTICELGAGFGRLTPIYSYRAKKIILCDPSAKLLKVARENLKNKKYNFIHSKIENINKKLKSGYIDLAIVVRVFHHIKNLEEAVLSVSKLLTSNGYFILEFANKCHGKAAFHEFFRGNLTFLHDIFPKEVRSTSRKKGEKIPFNNYHPYQIKTLLKENGFNIIEIRSVSNVRNQTIKKLIPQETLLSIESALQRPLSYLNFGPSIFILAQKK